MEIATVTAPWRAERGTVLFRQGDPGDRLLVLTSGRLDVLARSPPGEQRVIGSVSPGEVVGELALLFGGRRTATVVATEDSEGFALQRQTFAYLRIQRRPVALSVVQRIGDTALHRLRRRYTALAADLAPSGEERAADFTAGPLRPASRHDHDLAPVLFFQSFTPAEIAELRDGGAVLSADRLTELPQGDAVWIVLAGAVETLLDNGRAHRRVRLAGPGRVVGHLAVEAARDHGLPLRARLRERAVLLKLPVAAAEALMSSDLPHARRFTEAFYEDGVRALIAAETMQVPVVTHPVAAARA